MSSTKKQLRSRSLRSRRNGSRVARSTVPKWGGGKGKLVSVSVPRARRSHMDKKMLGTWKVVSCQLNGVWLPREIFMMFRYEITDGAFKIQWADLSFPNWVGSFPKSDSGKMLGGEDGSTLDIIPDKGPNAGKTYKGLYDLDHDILKANFAFPGHSRPTIFSAKQGEVYEVWQRV